jgi:intracellular sulfur oxidation DsrE/DsrF family protein
MKNHFLITLFVFVGSVLYTPVLAQSISVSAVENAVKKNGKYAILVPSANYFQAAVMTGKTLKAKYPKSDFHIVLISSVVKDLATDESLKSFIEMSEKAGIHLVVCDESLQNKKIRVPQFHLHNT